MRGGSVVASALAIAIAIAALLSRSLLGQALPPGLPFVTFFPSILLCTFLLGTIPGVVCAIASTVLAWRYLIATPGSLYLSSQGAVALAFFDFIVIINIMLIHLLRRSWAQLDAEKSVTRDLNAELERRVADRTADLVIADAKYEVAQERIAFQDKAEQQQAILQRELAHRIKNTLAMVMSIVSQSKRFSTSMDEMYRAISERIGALAHAQDILRESNDESADMRDVISGSLRPHLDRADRVSIEGPKVQIDAQQALGLALAMHELGTNAVKYGALSAEGGRIDIRWTLNGSDASFRLEWKEHGGPTLTEPTRFGFGSRLTGSIVASYFQGAGQNFYEPDGLRFVLDGKLPQALRPL